MSGPWQDDDVDDGSNEPDLHELWARWRRARGRWIPYALFALFFAAWGLLLLTLFAYISACRDLGGHVIPTALWITCA